jgi:CheY-like chemotaxis protein
MSFKRALVVDDSKSARMALKGLLEQNGLIVEFAESGEEAIEFLKSSSVDVIFMDHSMPGMTGLEAVSAIKADPKTAMIPVMMYTAKEGEVYVGQARALGAVGVLPKQVQPGVLFEMLLKLGLVRERRGKGRAPPEGAPKRRAQDKGDEVDRALEQQALGISVQALVSRILQDQHVELRSDILRSHYDFAKRVAAEIFERQQAELAAMEAEKTPPPKPGYSGGLVLAMAVLLIVPALVLLVNFQSVREQRDEALAANQALATAAEQRLLDVEAMSSGLAADITAERERAEARFAGMVGALEWALGQGGSIPYGELAFDGRRLEMLRELLSQLVALDFRGVVRLESYLGEFCLVQDGAGGYELPRAAMPLERCEFIGHPLDDSDLVSDRQSVAFANFLATSPLVNEAGIDVQIIAHDRTRHRRRAQFPAGVRTAGEWNRIAEQNNRVEFVLLPSTP